MSSISHSIILKSAIENHEVLNLTYKKNSIEEKQYKVEPYEIRDGLAVHVWDLAEGKIKMMYIDKIKSLSKTGDKFTPRFPRKL